MSPWDRVAMDLMVADSFIKWVEAFPVPEMSTATVTTSIQTSEEERPVKRKEQENLKRDKAVLQALLGKQGLSGVGKGSLPILSDQLLPPSLDRRDRPGAGMPGTS